MLYELIKVGAGDDYNEDEVEDTQAQDLINKTKQQKLMQKKGIKKGPLINEESMLFFWIGFNFKRSNINQEEDQIREQDDEDVEGAPREK